MANKKWKGEREHGRALCNGRERERENRVEPSVMAKRKREREESGIMEERERTGEKAVSCGAQ